MKYIIICSCLLMLSVTSTANAAADKQEFWVVGSFKEMQGATKERRRIENTTNLTVQIAFFDYGGTTKYRLVVPKDGASKAELENLELYPWMLAVSQISLAGEAAVKEAAVKKEMVAAVEPEPVKKVEPVAIPEPVNVPVVPVKVELPPQDHYLVLASYAEARLAELFVNQMGSDMDAPMNINKVQFANKTSYRVVLGPFDEQLDSVRARYNSLGLSEIWWLSVNASYRMKFEPKAMIADAEETSVVDDVPIFVDEIVAVEPLVVGER
ncbi:MAG: hypothetical protein ABGY96_01500 [bacterium]|nr:hypothetical protein [Gammaproteobacteria bacterium]HIL96276.1 hypothetical protein [Pseudomonadales bacterium]